MENPKCPKAIFSIIYLLFCIWAITYPVGCSQKNDNISTENIFSNGKVELSWDKIYDANSYNIYVSNESGVTKHNSYKIQNVANPFTIVDLEPGSTYYFSVTVVDDFGEGEKSKEISYRVTDPEGYIKIENLLGSQDLKIFFNSNSTKLSNSEIKKLDRFVKFVQKIPGYHVTLDGYSDSSGDIEYNKAISKNRTAVVKSYLVDRGVEAESIDITWHGAINFIANNETAEGRRMNRRVEINFYSDK